MFLYHINFKYKILIPNSEPSKSFEIILTPKQMYIFEIKSKLSSTEVGRMPESIVFLHAHVWWVKKNGDLHWETGRDVFIGHHISNTTSFPSLFVGP